MNRIQRLLAAGMVVLALGAPLAVIAQAQPTSARETDVRSSLLRECTSKQHSLSVLFLVDASQSLKAEDPLALRSVGIELAIDALARQVQAEMSSNRGFNLYVDFLLFGSLTRRAFPDVWPEWGAIREGGITEDLRQAIRNLGYESNDSDTDYLSALDPWLGRQRPADDPTVGALEVLKDAPEGSCRLLVWFTDGRFDFDPPGSSAKSPKTLTWTDSVIRNEDDAKKVRDEGYRRICQPNGPIDALRALDITRGSGAELAVVALGDPTRFSFIERLVTNSNENCGKEKARGSVYASESIDELIFQLIQAVIGDPGKPPSPSGTCSSEYRPGSRLAEESCQFAFTLSPGIGSFDLLVLRGSNLVRAQLISPDREVVDLGTIGAAGTMSNGTRLRVNKFESIDSLIPVRGELGDDPNKWAGTWILRFWSPIEGEQKAVNQSLVFVFQGEISARLRESGAVLRRGSESLFVVELISASETLITQSEVRPDISLSLMIGDERLEAGTVRSDGTWEISYAVEANYESELVPLVADLTASVRVQDGLPSYTIGNWNGIDLGALTIRDVPKYPVIDRPVSKFERALSQKDRTTEAKLVVVAPDDEGGGCVTLERVSEPVSSDGSRTGFVRVFDGNDQLSVGDECALKLNAGESSELTIEVSAGNGDFAVIDSIAGTVSLRSSSDIDPSRSEVFVKEVVVSVAPSLVTSPDYKRALLLAMTALAVALAVLYALSWYDARIDIGPSSLVAVPVVFRNGRLYRRENGSETEFGYRDDEVDRLALPGPGKFRRVKAQSVEFKGQMSRSPFGDVSGRAKSLSGERVVSVGGATSDGEAGQLSASLHNAWAFSYGHPPRKVDGGISEVEGNLTLVVDSDFDQARDDVGKLTPMIEQKLSAVLSRHAVDEARSLNLAPEPPLEADSSDGEIEGDRKALSSRRRFRRERADRSSRATEEMDSQLSDDFEIDDPY